MAWCNFETKMYRGIVQDGTGDIIAYSNNPAVRMPKKLNVKDNVNAFPYTDDDYIILAARKVIN